jgi:hypothetical protein
MGQALVYELDHGSALADRGRAALDRAGAHVAGRVDPWHARLEQALGAGVRAAGQDETVAVTRNQVTEPLGARLSASSPRSACPIPLKRRKPLRPFPRGLRR